MNTSLNVKQRTNSFVDAYAKIRSMRCLSCGKHIWGRDCKCKIWDTTVPPGGTAYTWQEQPVNKKP